MRGARQPLGQAHDCVELGVLCNIGEGDRPPELCMHGKADESFNASATRSTSLMSVTSGGILLLDRWMRQPPSIARAPLHKANVRPITSFSDELRDSERALLMETLESVGWLIAGANGAAAKMGLPRTTLLEKMKRLGISKRERFGISQLAET
jgi:transcriptional regulator with GAF, ATPase, and Fis domain